MDGPFKRCWNHSALTCVQVDVGKKLWLVLCLLVLVGCAHTVEGKAIVEDAWHGQGVTKSPASSSAPKPPSTTASSSGFDPCGFDEITLSVAVGVDPETKLEVPGGCSWSGESTRFAAMMAPSLPVESLATTRGVTELDELKVGVHTVHVFVHEGDSCNAIVDIGGETLQLIMMEDEFSAFCIRMRVAARLLLEDV